MPALVKVDNSRLKRRLADLLALVGGDSRAILRTEMARLIEDLANATTKPDRQHKRISRDFFRSFRPTKGAFNSPDLQELYRVLDAFGQGGKRLPTGARAFFIERHRHRQRIGFLAAGWTGGGNPMRAKVPVAATRQPAHGSFQIIDTPTQYILTATNRVRFARHMRGLTIIIQKAINKRAGSIKTNMRLIRAGVKRYQFR